MAEQLATERRVFEKHLPEWRSDKVGQFVLIKGTDVAGFFASLDEATSEGFHRFGLEDFFVDQIRPDGVTNVTFVGQYLYQVHRG